MTRKTLQNIDQQLLKYLMYNVEFLWIFCFLSMYNFYPYFLGRGPEASMLTAAVILQ